MLRADAGTEATRRAALYAGAVLFASWCAQWSYYVIHHSGRIGAARPFGPISVMLAAFGGYAAIALHDRFLKTAAILFAADHLLGLVPSISATVTGALLLNGLIGLTAVLLVVAGTRHRTRMELVLAVVVFSVSVAVFLGLTEYSRYVFSGRSVMYGR